VFAEFISLFVVAEYWMYFPIRSCAHCYWLYGFYFNKFIIKERTEIHTDIINEDNSCTLYALHFNLSTVVITLITILIVVVVIKLLRFLTFASLQFEVFILLFCSYLLKEFLLCLSSK